MRQDVFWGLINDIWEYHLPLSSRITPLKPTFPTLSEDYIRISAYNETKEPHAFIERWKRIKKGILLRVWYSPKEADKNQKDS